MLYDFVDDNQPTLKAGVTASSRKFKKAADRNRVKRIIKETYRIQKLPLQEMLMLKGKSLVLFFIYLSKELPVYSEVNEKMGVLLKRLTNEIKDK